MKDQLYEAVFAASERLEVPVVLLAVASLAWVLVELGAFVAEVLRRRPRTLAALTTAATDARRALDDGDRDTAGTRLASVAWSESMAGVLAAFAHERGRPAGEAQMAKQLADFDFGRQRRLGRTRLLVRSGPALGLMGTLIPLSPALEGLAGGDLTQLSDNLRLAFSITVLGILVGAVAFALSLARDRIYGQDFSDLEFVAAVLTDPATSSAESVLS